MYLSKSFVFLITFVTVLIASVNSENLSNDVVKSKAEPNFNKISETSLNLVDTLKKQVKAKENELHKAEIINKNFERMVQLVKILGQVDTFLTEKTKTLIKKLAALADVSAEEESANQKE